MLVPKGVKLLRIFDGITALLLTKLQKTNIELYGVICGATLLKKLLVLEPTWVSG